MKKVSLFFLVAVFSLATYAQKGAKYKVALAPQNIKSSMINEPAPSNLAKSVATNPVVKPKGIPSKNAKDVQIIELGSSANCFSIIAGHKNQLNWEPSINTFVMAHRGGGPLGNGETGNDVTYDFSTDGGISWTINHNPGPYMQPGGGLQVSRYPNGNIFNPAGNTNPNNAYCLSAGVVHSGGWESAEYQGGAIKLDGTSQHDTVVNCGVLGRGMDLPGNCIMTKTGTAWVVQEGVDAVGGAGRQYIDTIYFMKGQMNAGSQRYQWEMLHKRLPSLNYSDLTKSFLDNVQISFMDNGLDGILSFTGFVDTNQYKPENSTLWFMKTNDGGQTWTGLTGCNFIDIPEIRNFIDSMDVVDLFGGAPVPPRSQWFYLPWGEADMIIDQYGNPHFNVMIALGSIKDNYVGNYGYGSFSEFRGMFHIWYDMACGEWFAHVIGRPHTVNGSYAGLNEEGNRPYIMRSYEGDKIFFSYLETDTVTYAGWDNTQPDIRLMGFDAVNRTHTPLMNMTVGTDAEGVAHMGTASYYVRTASATEWEIPYVYGSWNQFNQNDLYHFFIKGFMVSTSDLVIEHPITESNVAIIAPTTPGGNNGSITVTVSCGVPVTSATICGASGKKAHQSGATNYTFVFNDLSIGLYTMYFQNADGDFFTAQYEIEENQILYEPFNYTIPGYIGGNGGAGSSSNNWTTHSVTSGQTTTVNLIFGSLDYTGLATSTGNKVDFFSAGNTVSRDINRTFSSGGATDLYYSLLINIIDSAQINSANFDYFFGFGQTSGSALTIMGARLGIKKSTTDYIFRLGILNTSGGTPVYTDFGQDFNYGTTYLIVVHYDISSTPTTANLWVNPTNLGGTAPTTGFVTNTTGTGSFSGLESVFIRNNAFSPKAYIDEIRVGNTWASVTPTKTFSVTPSSLNFGNQLVSTTSSAQTYVLTGSNLTNNVTITAPTGFEVSLNGTTYASSQTVIPSSGSVNQTVYVRFIPTAVQAYSGNVTNASAGAPTLNVAVSGISIAPTPTLSAIPSLLNFGNQVVNTNSSAQTYTLTGSNLSANVSITAPTGFEVSLNGTTYASSQTVIPSSGSVNQTVYVRFIPTAVQAYSGNVTNASTGATTQNVAVSGTGIAPPTPTLSVFPSSLSFGNQMVNTTSTTQTYSLYGYDLSANISITAPTGFEVSIDGTSFASTQTVIPIGDSVNQTVYVRFIPSAIQAYTGNITNTSTGANTQNVAVSGTGIAVVVPEITLNPTSINFGNVPVGSISGAQSYNVTGTNLVADITVTAVSGFEVSLNGTTFAAAQTLTQSGGNVNQLVYVRFAPMGIGSYSSSIIHTSTNATTKFLAVSGNSVGIHEIAAELGIQMYPNPAKDIVNIQFNNTLRDIEIVISDIYGKMVNTFVSDNINANEIKTIDISKFAKGMYLITIKAEGRQMQTKLMVE